MIPAKTLPRIPVTLRVTLANTGGERAELPREVFLLVTPQGGERFVTRHTARNSTEIDEGNGAILVKYWPETFVEPRKSVTVAIEPDGGFGEPLWFEDERLHRPGLYHLEVALGYGVAIDRRFHTLEHVVARSTPATLEILEPKGDDAAVWAALEKSLEKRPVIEDSGRERRAAWKAILEKYPDSAYAGWILMAGVAEEEEEENALTREWLRKHPDAPHADVRWLSVVEGEMYLGLRDRNPEKRAAHDREAQRLLKQLSSSKSAFVRWKAAKLLEELGEE